MYLLLSLPQEVRVQTIRGGEVGDFATEEGVDVDFSNLRELLRVAENIGISRTIGGSTIL